MELPPPSRGLRSRKNLRRRSKRLIDKSKQAIADAEPILFRAKVISARFNLKVDSSILDASYQSNFLPTRFKHGGNDDMPTNGHHTQPGEGRNSPATNNKNNSDSNSNSNSEPKSSLLLFSATPTILRTTGGYSNTDHLIQCTGDPIYDKISEYKRSLRRRAKSVQPEQRGSDRWDQPRIAGTRRRRIMREKDLPKAPPEPPLSGYVVFITQMTTKVRHGRPNERHDQISVVKQISKMWKYGLSSKDRTYYNDFARESREEYQRQHTEFRATGTYSPSAMFERIDGDGPWVKSAYHEKNALERELATYACVKFPPRPDNVEDPFWVKRMQRENERGMQIRKVMEEKRKKEEEEKWDTLEIARRAKAKRLRMASVEIEEEAV